LDLWSNNKNRMGTQLLFYGFLVIFFATAILGILSLPGWVKIEEWYKKKLFLALILEVIGVIILVAKQDLINNDFDISISRNDWVALNDSGLLVNPEHIVTYQDTSIINNFGKQSFTEFKGLNFKIIDTGLSIRNSNDKSFGSIKASDLERKGIFNSFEYLDNELSYSYIKWEKIKNKRWQRIGKISEQFELEVADYIGGTYYIIKNIAEKSIVFNSKDQSKDLFQEDNRIIHFHKHKNDYYFLRIAWADLDSKRKKYVHIVNVKMKPIFKTK